MPPLSAVIASPSTSVHGAEGLIQENGPNLIRMTTKILRARDLAEEVHSASPTEIAEYSQAVDLFQAEGELLRREIEFQDRERQLVACEIHEGLLQRTAGALMHVEALQGGLESASAGEEIEHIAGLLRTILAEGRRIMNGLRPPVLDDAGAVGAIQQLVDEEERAHCPIEFVWDEDFERLSPTAEEALYRLAQEAVLTALQHPQTKKVRIRLHRCDDRVRLEVQDWGLGIAARRTTLGVNGFRGLSERAKIAGGFCSIERTLGRGTRICVNLPYVRRQDA